MSKKRNRYNAQFKSKVALEAVKGVHTLSELSSKYGVHPTLIGQWKQRLVQDAKDLFEGNGHKAKTEEELTAPLFEEIGRLKMEMDWLKKKF